MWRSSAPIQKVLVPAASVRLWLQERGPGKITAGGEMLQVGEQMQRPGWLLCHGCHPDSLTHGEGGQEIGKRGRRSRPQGSQGTGIRNRGIRNTRWAPANLDSLQARFGAGGIWTGTMGARRGP